VDNINDNDISNNDISDVFMNDDEILNANNIIRNNTNTKNSDIFDDILEYYEKKPDNKNKNNKNTINVINQKEPDKPKIIRKEANKKSKSKQKITKIIKYDDDEEYFNDYDDTYDNDYYLE
jgi:hypothetical protein